MLAGHTVLLCSPLLLSPGQRQLSKQRNGLPVPVEHQDVVLVHDRVVATTNGLQHTHTLNLQEACFSACIHESIMQVVALTAMCRIRVMMRLRHHAIYSAHGY